MIKPPDYDEGFLENADRDHSAQVDHCDRETSMMLVSTGMLPMVFHLGQSTQNHWRRLRGFKHLADVIHGIKFENGVRFDNNDSRVAT